jgi:hypothetical protein
VAFGVFETDSDHRFLDSEDSIAIWETRTREVTRAERTTERLVLGSGPRVGTALKGQDLHSPGCNPGV